MPLLGFTVFKDKILNEDKRQTIRKLRKRPITEGDVLHLYWKLRTKQCKKLGIAFCVEEYRISMSIDQDKLCVLLDQKCFGCGWHKLNFKELWKLATDDGFESIEEMKEWFKKTHSNLDGETFQVIRWGNIFGKKDSLHSKEKESK